MKFFSLSLFFGFIITSCSGNGKNCVVGENKQTNCEALNTFQLADSSRNITFTHHCSKQHLYLSSYWQSYALFENQNESQKAVAIGNINVGFIKGVQKVRGLSLNLEKMKLHGFSSWASHHLALAIELVNLETQKSSTGSFVTSYLESKSGTFPVKKDYQVFSNGDLEWEQFMEPESQTADEKISNILEEYPSILSQNIDVEANYRIYLLIQNQDIYQTIRLKGPVIKNLKEHLILQAPEHGVLSFLDVINPFQKGGLWDFFISAFRYKDCIYLRKQSKYELNKRFL